MEQSQVTDSTPSTHFAGQNPFELTRPGDGPRDLRDLIQERSHLWDGKTPTSAHRTCFQSAPSPHTSFHRPTKLAALEFKRTGHFALLSSLSQKHWAQLPPTCLCPHLLYPAAPRKHTSFSLLHTHTHSLTHQFRGRTGGNNLATNMDANTFALFCPGLTTCFLVSSEVRPTVDTL